jgi:hypothetical protein
MKIRRQISLGQSEQCRKKAESSTEYGEGGLLGRQAQGEWPCAIDAG